MGLEWRQLTVVDIVMRRPEGGECEGFLNATNICTAIADRSQLREVTWYL
jgi:hypothetical protein